MSQNQYISNWHNSFVNYIEYLLNVVCSIVTRPELTCKEKEGLDAIKLVLIGEDATDVEMDLASGVVRESTLDKIERLDKELADICLEYIENVFVREFLRKMVHVQVEHNKQAEKIRLRFLQIPIND